MTDGGVAAAQHSGFLTICYFDGRGTACIATGIGPVTTLAHVNGITLVLWNRFFLAVWCNMFFGTRV